MTQSVMDLNDTGDHTRISSFIDREFITLNVNDTIDKAIGMLLKLNITNLPVVDEEGKIKGSITYPTIIEMFLNGNGLATKVSQVMHRDFLTYHENESINRSHLNLSMSTPVVNEIGQVIGMLNPEKIIKKLIETKKNLKSLEEIIRMYEFCFDTAYEGITVVDSNGYIKLFNEPYTRFTGVRRNEAIGKHCTEVIENTRLTVVLETGIPERNQPHILQGQSMIVHRLPIWRGNTIIGAVGVLIFEGVSELYDTYNRAHQFFDIDNDNRSFAEYPKRQEKVTTFDQIIGESLSLGKAKKIARKAAKTTATMLLTGESGVGKELFAQSIHSVSPVSNGPLISVNCAAIPADLLESELFGYEHGAFTGAKKGGKPGKFELAHGGTLFLDEIGEMSHDLQAKLLRILQEQRFERVGGSTEIEVDVRIIVATNKSLEEQIKKGEFREDLYYRINVIPVTIPSLRERKTDIPLLVANLLKNVCNKYQLPSIDLSKEAMSALLAYHWPGNVRELANIIERVVVLAENKRVELRDLPKEIIGVTSDSNIRITDPQSSFKKIETPSNEQIEIDLIMKVMEEVGGNKSEVARKLGIHRSTLYKKLQKYELT